jgi:hypothetical protein
MATVTFETSETMVVRYISEKLTRKTKRPKRKLRQTPYL